MQDLLAELLWRNEEIDEAAARLCETLPGFPEAEQQYRDTARQVRNMIGPELYEQFYCQFMHSPIMRSGPTTPWAWVCARG